MKHFMSFTALLSSVTQAATITCPVIKCAEQDRLGENIKADLCYKHD
jgi:hypothetical protein